MTKDHAFIIWWNNMFPLDKKYREKYGIAFGSEEHRRVCQIDVYLEWLEGSVYDELLEKAIVEYQKEEQLKKGILIKESVLNTEQEEELINNISLDSFKNITVV